MNNDLIIDSYGSRNKPPKMVETYIPRKNIMDILDLAPRDQMVYMAAPSGYGKTQAVLEWLNRHGCEAVFCSLDESDNCMDSLLENLSASLMPAVGEKPGLTGQAKPPENLHELLLKAVSDVDGVQNRALVVRKLNRINAPDTLKLLKDCIASLLGIWRVFVLSSGMIPPVFNDLVMAGRVHFITAEELRLDTAEIKMFFNRIGIETANDSLALIEANTKGWFAALNAMAADLKTGEKHSYEQAGLSFVFRFFDTEIWNGLDEDTRRFLIKTSILDRLDPSACYALTGIEDASDFIPRLYNRGVFISKNEDGSFEYHPAFRKYLRRKLDARGVDINKLHIKLAWWFYNQEDYASAFRYFFSAKFLFGIDKALKKFNLSNMLIEEFLELVGGITTLNPYELKQFPNILAKMALIEHLTGNTEKMKEMLSLFMEWTEPGALPISPEEYAEFYWEIGWLRYLNPDETQLNNKRLESFANSAVYLPRLEKQHLARAAVLGFPSIFRGAKDYSSIAPAIEQFVSSTEDNTQAIVKDRYTLLEIRLILAEYYYETERLSEALKETRKVLPDTLTQPHAYLYFGCVSLIVKIMRAMNDTNEIEDVTASVEKCIRDKDSFFLLPNFHAFQQINFLKGGNAGFIDTFREENIHLVDKNHFYLLYRKIAYARVLISLENYNQSLLLLDSLETLCEKYKRTVDLIEVCLLKSITLLNLNDEISAAENLKKAIRTGEPYGYIRVFTDESAGLLPVFNLLGGKDTSGAYVKQILISAKKTSHKYGEPRQNVYVKLTKTEIQILKLLRDTLTYKEIAFELGIKLSTVRTHVQSIYGKLGVNNKTAAVNKAKEQGIL